MEIYEQRITKSLIGHACDACGRRCEKDGVGCSPRLEGLGRYYDLCNGCFESVWKHFESLAKLGGRDGVGDVQVGFPGGDE